MVAVAVVAFLFAGIIGCGGDIAPPESQLAATRNANGSIAVLYTFCSGKPLVELQVGVLDEQTRTVKQVLWRIRASTTAEPAKDPMTGQVVIGVVPPGYEETVRLGQPLPDDERLWVQLATERPETQGGSFGHSLTFRPADVPRGSAFDDDSGQRTLDEYRNEASETCAKFD